MRLLLETVLLPDALVRIELADDFTYRLSYDELVVYENGKRRVRGRMQPYELRSVEQLRYDFERDVEAVGGRLG
ncbi:MAG TPA: hypothetical protein VEV21_11715 [Burkholderiales bacterium]|jgi:hypothetical protein|nr:hypothetical protein [Burkholderiales bacterium]